MAERDSLGSTTTPGNSPSVIRPESFTAPRLGRDFHRGRAAYVPRLLFRVASSMRYAYLRDCRGGLLLRCSCVCDVELSRIDLDGPVFNCCFGCQLTALGGACWCHDGVRGSASG